MTFGGALVIFALEREAAPLRRRCRHKQDLLIAVAGIGRTRARERLIGLLERGTKPNVVVMAGFAGALQPGSRVGDVIRVSEIVDDSGNRWPTGWPGNRSGRLLTTDRLIGDTAEKLELGKRHQAQAVDMEAAAVAEVCRQRGLVFGCIRAISDDMATPLSPRLLRMLSGGRISVGSVCRELLCSPRLLPELLRLGRDTKKAANELAAALQSSLTCASG